MTLYLQLKAAHKLTLDSLANTQVELASVAAHAKEVEARHAQTQQKLTDVREMGAKQEQKQRQQVAQLEQTIGHLQHELEATRYALEAHKSSTSWRLTSPVRFVGRQLLRAKLFAKAFPYAVSMSGGVKTLPGYVFRAYRREGFKGVKRRILFSAKRGDASPAEGQALPRKYDYREWLFRYDTLTDDAREVARRRINSWARLPLVSVVMPVYNPPLAMLTAAIASVQGQLYSNWELCIADDASHSEVVRALLLEYADQDARIRLAFRAENGHISAASNTALGLATGEYIALLDNDDLLHEMALFWVADAIKANPSAGLIYSDEDKVDVAGNRFDPYFKPEWNPDLFLSHNMICHLGVYRTELIKSLGGFREGLEGAQDYDLALRCVEQLAKKDIVHIPRVLYHWRSHPGSTARAGSEKSYAIEAGQRALNEHFSRTGLDARVEVLNSGMYRARYVLPVIKPLVSLVILTRNDLAHVKQCIDSIFAKTTYKNYEILLLDNNSDDPGALAYFRLLADDSRVRVLRDERVFNYSALNNSAVHHTRGEYIALIHSDIEVISPDWLDEMLGLASQPGVGAVGARLWYPDNTLQHGGVITGLRGVAGHSHKHLCKGAPGYFYHAQIIKTVSVVTAACLLIKKSVFFEVGGLNEVELKVAFNDVDFCLRVREAGYRNIWTPYAEFYHHESPTDGLEDIPEKQTRLAEAVHYLKARWGATLTNDPAYSPNLTLDREDFSYAWPPRTPPIY